MSMNATEIASFFIRKYGSDLYLTNLKLNMLVYFSQVETIKVTGDFLFQDDIQAWEYGPVEPSVYAAYRKFGRGRIEETSETVPSSKDSNFDLPGKIIDRVAASYGHMTVFELVEYSHRSGSAWRKAYEPEGNRIITKQMILDSQDIRDKPNMKRTLSETADTLETHFPNAFRMLQAFLTDDE